MLACDHDGKSAPAGAGRGGFEAGAPRVLAVDVDGMIHPVTAEISRAIAQAKQENAASAAGPPEYARRPDGRHARNHREDGRLADAGGHLRHAQRRARGIGGILHPGGRRRGGHGARHQYRRGASGDDGRRDGRRDEAEGGERRGRIAAQHLAKRGRNSALAEKAVRESQSFTDKEALDNHLIELVAPDERDLLDRAGRPRGDALRWLARRRCTRAARPSRSTKESARQRIISAIADPNIALVLLVLGALGIYVEFSSPGLIVPGIVGAIMVLLGFSALSVLPINWLGAALLLLAFALFILEAKFATHGILGVGGAVSMVLGAVMLIDSPVPEMRIHLSHGHRAGAAFLAHHHVAALAGGARPPQ